MMTVPPTANRSTGQSCSASDEGQRSSADGSADSDVSTTLYFGNLHPFVQQRSLEDLCGYFGVVESSKVIKDKGTGANVGYGFVKFVDRKDAEGALQALNGTNYLGQELRVNWALPNSHKEDTSYHHHVFVGDLGSDVTDAVLYNAFCTIGQCSDARVMWDHSTGRSKGYGFVSFRQKEDAEAAIDKMQAELIGSRRIRVGWAQHKHEEAYVPADSHEVDRADPSNTNVYIGNIAPETSEADLHDFFSGYGPVAEIKLHKKGGYGFVKYEAHDSAVKAIVGHRGQDLHGRVLKCSWGRNITSCNKPSMSVPSGFCQTLQGPGFASHHSLQGQMNASGTQNAAASLAAAASAKAITDALDNLSFNEPNMGSLPLSVLLGLAQGNAAQCMIDNAMMFNQVCMPQVMPQVNPVALAAQMMILQGLQNSADSRALEQAFMASMGTNLPGFNQAFNPMAGLELPGLFNDMRMFNAGMHRAPAMNQDMLLP